MRRGAAALASFVATLPVLAFARDDAALFAAAEHGDRIGEPVARRGRTRNTAAIELLLDRGAALDGKSRDERHGSAPAHGTARAPR